MILCHGNNFTYIVIFGQVCFYSMRNVDALTKRD